MILLKFFLTLGISPIILSLDPRIQLPEGDIIGRKAVTVNNKTYFAFEKIPYARPPVGDLRFKAPKPSIPWKEPLKTLNLDVCCWQVGFSYYEQSEDCLYFKIHTPALPSEEQPVNLPVMLFIHGGGFIQGCASDYRSDYLIEENVILVVINYRLGPFGFLSTQDEIIPGNYGLKDQKLAIEWVYNNINLFGGDPNRITIFGQSGGSASVSYQLLQQDLKGKIAGAILHSGTIINPWAFQRNARPIAFKTASFLSDTYTSSNNSSDLFSYLSTVAAEDLATAAKKFFDYENSAQDIEIYQGCYWAPVIEVKNPDAFITRKMFGLVKNGNTIGVPIIIGMTSEESIVVADIDAQMAEFDKNLEWLVPNDMRIQNETQKATIGQQIRQIYTNGEPLVDHLRDGIKFSSDTAFSRAIIKYAELYSQFYQTYFYQFSYYGKLGGNSMHYKNDSSVGHSEDLRYFFCFATNCQIEDYPNSDQITVQRVIKLWTNFAKYQNPTIEESELLQNITWPLITDEDGIISYLNINQTLDIESNPKEKAYSKWVELYDSLEYQDFDTY